MSDHSATARVLWKPHPDDEEDIAEAMGAVDRGELLSPEASEAFLRWMEGHGDDSWRIEFESLPCTLVRSASSSRPARSAHGPLGEQSKL